MEEPETPSTGNKMEDGEISSSPQSSTPATPSTPTPPVGKSSTAEDKDGLEDRYNKLKTIAVKLKKKIHEQNEEIAQLEKEKTKFQNASKIQLEFDKAQDEVERLRSEKKVLEKDIQKAVEENVNLKVKTTEDSAKLQSLTASHKVLRERLEKLEKEVTELEQFRARTEELEKELKGAKESEANAEQEKRQSAILSLEITDYERKLQDASKQLEEKKAEVEALRKDLAKRSEVIEGQEKSLQEFREREERLISTKESLQADIQRKLEKISFIQDEMNKMKEKLSEKSLEYIRLEQEYENSKLAFSSQSKELVEKCDGFQRMIATLEHKISVLEENKRSRETHVANLKLEIQQLESEYTNYKTKAQTMLKSQKPGSPEQQSDELENLQKIVQNFQSDISILKTDLQTLKLENDNLLMEKSEMTLRFNQSKTDSLEKEIRLNNELQKLKQELRQKDELQKIHLEEIQRANAQSLSAHEQKMESLKEKYEAHIHRLQDQLDSINYDMKNENHVSGFGISSIPSHSSAFRPVISDGGDGGGQAAVGAPSQLTGPRRLSDPESDGAFEPPLHHNHSHHHQPLAIIDTSNLSFEQLRMIPRGEGEGSESVTSAFTPRASVDNYLSFEQLLSSSLDSSGAKDGLEGDLEKSNRDAVNFKEQLIRSQNQVNHLTALLRESESNCDRLAQLSDALKEEIRRVEREKERKEHLKENTEYLKNVLLKFMTLNGEEERRRLIPVMKTMLQLTNEEVSRLENSLSGGGNRDFHGTSQHSGGSGWSSYLPLWGSGGQGHGGQIDK